MFIVHRIVFIFNTIAILALLASFLAPFITPELSWQIAFLGLAFPAIVVINVLFIIYWSIFLNLKFMFSLAAIIIGWNYIPRYIQFNAIKAEQSSKDIIRVVSFNSRYFNYPEQVSTADEESFFDKLTKINPDIICMQEMFNGISMPSDIGEQFQKKYRTYNRSNIKLVKGKWVVDDIGILSRFPIVNKGVVERDTGSGNYTIYADIVKGDDTIRVVSTHLKSNGFVKKEYEAVAVVETLSDEGDSVHLSNYKLIVSKMKRAFMMRAKQVDAIHEFLDKSPHKIILCGDFNDSPTSYSYRTLRGDFKDSFMEAGSGLGRTYVGKMPALRIDYILGDPSFSFYNYYAKSFDFSDHKLVSCSIKIK